MHIGIWRASGWKRVLGDSGDVYRNVRGHLCCGPSSGLPQLGGLDEGSQPMSFREMLRVILPIVTEFSLLSRPAIYCKLLFFSFRKGCLNNCVLYR